jgi:hypothetical protein
MMRGRMKPFAVPTMVWAMPIMVQAVPTMVWVVPIVVHVVRQIPKVPHMKFP